jgi:hypothetical protein
LEPGTGTSNGECRTKKINKNVIFIPGATCPCHSHYTENFPDYSGDIMSLSIYGDRELELMRNLQKRVRM